MQLEDFQYVLEEHEISMLTHIVSLLTFIFSSMGHQEVKQSNFLGQ